MQVVGKKNPGPSTAHADFKPNPLLHILKTKKINKYVM